jgi:hypothetical protein
MKVHGAILASFALITIARRADAYRPFDGTDADVADLGAFELELGPAQFLHLDHQTFLQAPATVLNYGLAPGWEIVADVRDQFQLPLFHGHGATFVDNDLLLKAILREGTLQEKTGVSIATEFGMLFPNMATGDEKYVGLADNVIVSYRFAHVTAHLNSQIALDRTTRADWFESLIMEGQWDWTVRPVAEAYVEKEWAGFFTRSILGGVIARASDSLYLDAAFRFFRESDDASSLGPSNGYEIRFGLTWSIPIVHPDRTKSPTEPEGEHASLAALQRFN